MTGRDKPGSAWVGKRRLAVLWSTIAAFLIFTIVIIIVEDVQPSFPWNETTTEPTPTPTPTEEPTPTPTPTPSPTSRFDPVPTVTPPPEPASIEGISTTEVPPPLDEVKGLLEIVLDDEDAGEIISVPQAIRFPQLQQAAETYVKDQRDALEAEADGGNGRLEVSFRPLVATGQILGVTQQSTRYSPRAAYGLTQTRSLYLDVLRGETYRGLDLLTDHAKEQLTESIYAALVEAGVLKGHLGQDKGTWFSDVRFSDDGDMVIVIGQGRLAPRQAGLLAVKVPAAEVPALLSGDGKTVYELVTRGAEFTGLRTDEKPDCSKLKCVALTFDDGPNANTPATLDALTAKGAPATFFLLGSQVEQNPELLKRIVADGHDIGGHSWRHPDLTTLDPEDLTSQLTRTRNAIRDVTGLDHVWERPPYGAVNDDVLAEYKRLGYTGVMWEVDPEDWRDRDAKIVTDRVVSHARENSIVLLHDIHATTGEAVPGIIDKLRAEGFTLVRLSDVVEPAPGTVVRKLDN